MVDDNAEVAPSVDAGDYGAVPFREHTAYRRAASGEASALRGAYERGVCHCALVPPLILSPRGFSTTHAMAGRYWVWGILHLFGLSRRVWRELGGHIGPPLHRIISVLP